MTDNKKGRVAWMDLTVENADEVSQFYKEVVGWEVQSFDMGGYNDYCMNEADSKETVAGVCHARGANAGIPPQWLVYIYVDDLDRSLEAVEQEGGKVLGEKRSDGKGGHYCLIQDPAGAYMMIAG